MQYATYTRDHWADIAAYEDSVVSGDRPACQWEKLAIKRHLKDLDSANEDDYPYYFDFDKALEPIHFIECFTHVKGKWSRGKSLAEKLIQLSPWQKWIIASIFGWRNKADGLRRFSLVYICVPRKNGKSVLAAGLSLFMLAADGEEGAEVYCGATTEKQAWEVFRPAKKMAAQQRLFTSAHGVEIHAKKLEKTSDGSRMEPLIGKPGDGSSPSFWVADEYHEHENDVFVDTMITGQGAREQGLGLIITTAGDNHEGPCFATEEDLKAILSGAVEDETFFGVVYTIDKDIDWRSVTALEMANPNMGVSVFRKNLLSQLARAKRSPRKQSTYKNKHLDVWVSARDAWLNMEYWIPAKQVFDLDDFLGWECGLGADLSESKDLTAIVKCFKKIIDGKDHYYFSGTYYTTEEQAKENKNYAQWIDDGHLVECDGAMIDYVQIEEDLEAEAEKYDIEHCFFDPKGAANLAQRVQNNIGIEAVRFEQSYTNFSPIMKDFESLLLDDRIHHDGNPCLTWMVGNIIAKTTMDGKDYRPVKASAKKKIDGGVAMLMAFANIYTPEDDDNNLAKHLESTGLRTL
ncbi:MAG: terminase large subunit [Agarilytica sp.]